MDTNIDNYTIEELFAILQITDESQINQLYIQSEIQKYITFFDKTQNKSMVQFFKDMDERMLEELQSYSEMDIDEEEEEEEEEEEDIDIFDPSNKNELALVDEEEEEGEQKQQEEKQEVQPSDQTNSWFTSQYLPQVDDPKQLDKVTVRKDKIDVYDNNHAPMKQDQLGVTTTVSIPVAQDSLNPTLQNTTTRFVNLDSQYRQIVEDIVSTDYTITLSDRLTNVLSLRLYSIQVPFAWYNVETTDNNDYFWVIFYDEETGNEVVLNNEKAGVPIIMENGNYTMENFAKGLIDAFTKAHFIFLNEPTESVKINPINGLLTLNLYGAMYTDPYSGKAYEVTETTILQFFDTNRSFDPSPAKFTNTTTYSNISVNNTLGYLMGFRSLSEFVKTTGNLASVMINLLGPKYIIVAIDDFNQNHINNDLVGVTQKSETIKLPSYYTPEMASCALSVTNDAYVLEEGNSTKTVAAQADSGIDDQLKTTKEMQTTKQFQVQTTYPRNLTSAQLYTINEIMKNNAEAGNVSTRYALSPIISDTLAIIPIKSAYTMGEMYTDFSGSLQDNKRSYFGPVNIDRMRIQLYNDKGNILNLHGSEWTLCLICETLYQY
jgi:hypothetical protein